MKWTSATVKWTSASPKSVPDGPKFLEREGGGDVEGEGDKARQTRGDLEGATALQTRGDLEGDAAFFC